MVTIGVVEYTVLGAVHSKNRYVIRSASPHSSVKITWKFVISTRKLVTLM